MLIFLLSLLLHHHAKCSSFDWRNKNLETDSFHSTILANEWIYMAADDALNLYDLMNMGNGIECSSFEDENTERLQSLCMAHTPAHDRHLRGSCGKNYGAKARHYTTTPLSKNMGDILELMKEHGSNTLLMMGASVTEQSTWDLSCGFQRLGFKISYYCTRHNKDPPCIHTDEEDILDTPSFLIEHPKAENEMQRKRIPYFNVIRHSVAMFQDYDHSVIARIAAGTNTTGSLVILFNFGLFYNDDHPENRQEYQNDITAVVQQLSLHAENHTIFFRETSAQHFRTETGLYDKSIPFGQSDLSAKVRGRFEEFMMRKGPFSRERLSSTGDHSNTQKYPSTSTANDTLYELIDKFYSCQPLTSMEHNWRNEILHDVLSQLPSLQVEVLPFFNITVPRYELHTQFVVDCTHFCKSPLLWIPLWEDLYRRLKKRYFCWRCISMTIHPDRTGSR